MASETLSYLSESLWRDRVLSDISIEYSGHVFKLHRLLLLQSPFLKQQLELTPSSTNVQLTFEDGYVTAEAMETCLSTLYGIEPDIDDNSILCVLATAHCLELHVLCSRCINLLNDVMTPSFFMELHAFNETWIGASAYSLDITSILDRYLCRTADNELKSSLHRLPRDDLQRLFTSKTLWISTEFQRFTLIMEVFKQMRQSSDDENDLNEAVTKSDSRGRLLIQSGSCPPISSFSSNHFGRSASSDASVLSDGQQHQVNIVAAYTEALLAINDMNNCKACISQVDCDFLESVLSDENIYYPCFSFAELMKARKQVQSMGLGRIVRCIETSLWTKSTLEGIIVSEAMRHGELSRRQSFDHMATQELAETVSMVDDRAFPCIRFSTEIKDIEAFQHSRDYTSEQVYFYGSLFRVYMTIGYSENNQDLVGIFLQRTPISKLDSWQFCDPRSSIDVHVEFIAGTRLLEMIELGGTLEAPHYNKGYFQFLSVADLPNYLSPSGSLRITAILRLSLHKNETSD